MKSLADKLLNKFREGYSRSVLVANKSKEIQENTFTKSLANKLLESVRSLNKISEDYKPRYNLPIESLNGESFKDICENIAKVMKDNGAEPSDSLDDGYFHFFTYNDDRNGCMVISENLDALLTVLEWLSNRYGIAIIKNNQRFSGYSVLTAKSFNEESASTVLSISIDKVNTSGTIDLKVLISDEGDSFELDHISNYNLFSALAKQLVSTRKAYLEKQKLHDQKRSERAEKAKSIKYDTVLPEGISANDVYTSLVEAYARLFARNIDKKYVSDFIKEATSASVKMNTRKYISQMIKNDLATVLKKKKLNSKDDMVKYLLRVNDSDKYDFGFYYPKGHMDTSGFDNTGLLVSGSSEIADILEEILEKYLSKY